MKNLRALVKNQLVKGSFVVLLGSAFAGFLNYSYHLIVGRSLLPEQYGVLQSFIALLYFVGVFTAPLSLSIINFISSIEALKTWSAIKQLEKKFFKISLIFWLVFLLFFPLFKSFLHLKNFFLYFIFSWQIFFSFLAIIYQATFQAKLKFMEFALLGIASPLMKILFAFLFIFFGWQVAGALGALACSTIGGTFLGRFWTLRYWKKEAKGEAPKINIGHHFWQYSLLSLITNFALVSIYSTDILLVRHFFSSYQSGIYSATSVLGKIIFFAATSILTVSFPLFIKFKKDRKKLRQTFWLSLSFILTICFLGVAGFKLFPNLVVSLLYGRGYQEAVQFLFPFALFISLFALLNLLLLFLLALENKMAAGIGGLVALGQIILIIARHDGLKMVIGNSIICVAWGVFLGLLFGIKVIYAKKD